MYGTNGKYQELDEGDIKIHGLGLKMVRNIYDKTLKMSDYRERFEIEKFASKSESMGNRKGFIGAAAKIDEINITSGRPGRDRRRLNTDNADAYEKNAKEYFAKLDASDASIRTLVAGGKRKTFIFGDRFPFRYFADEYGLSYFAAFPVCSTEMECSTATIAFLVDKIRDEKITAVFYIELSNEKIADTIREETGARKLLLHSVHNVSKMDFENRAPYHSLMTANLANLRMALY